jgi:uncharacterized membrane protein
MRIIPKYPKDIKKNPFYSGIIVGYVLSSGLYSLFFIDILFGFSLLCIGVVYYYKKEKEFNK